MYLFEVGAVLSSIILSVVDKKYESWTQNVRNQFCLLLLQGPRSNAGTLQHSWQEILVGQASSY
jgi:hypothetical protein